MAMRQAGHQPFAPSAAPMQPRQLGVEPRFIQEDQPRGIQRRLALAPGRPCGFYCGPALLVRVASLFLYVKPCC